MSCKIKLNKQFLKLFTFQLLFRHHLYGLYCRHRHVFPPCCLALQEHWRIVRQLPVLVNSYCLFGFGYLKKTNK